MPRADFADQIGDAILRFAGDPALYRRLGQAGAARVWAHYTWDGKVDRMIEIYHEVLAGARSRARPE